MLRIFASMAPPIALLMVGILFLEPPALTPRERVPTLRLLTNPPNAATRRSDIVLDPDPAPEPSVAEPGIEPLGDKESQDGAVPSLRLVS